MNTDLISAEQSQRSNEEQRQRDQDHKRGLAKRTALISVGVRAVLVVLKYTFAVLSGSLALMADAIHNVTDIAQSLALYLGVRISGRKSKTFPYGLYKLENLISLGVAILIALVGYELARKAILGQGPDEIRNLPWTMAAIVAAMAISFGFSRYVGAVAERTGSPALKADSRDALVDTLKTFAVLLSLVAAYFGYNIDTLATLLIVGFIIYTSAELAIGAIRVLLDASVDHDLLNTIEDVLRDDPDVLEVHDLTGRNSGPYRFIEAHVVLDVHDLEHAHQISYRLEEAVHEVAPNIDRVLLHLEPQHRETYVYAVPVADGDRLAPEFGHAGRYAFVTVGSEDRIVRDVRHVNNPYCDEPSGRGIRIAQMLIEEGADAVFTREDIEGKGPYYVLNADHVPVLHTDAETLPAALAEEQIHLEVPADGPEET
ncbi:MAG: cation diffusion facilitator family transporter [Armatimonadota bacterium]